jgi:hypothetical protein
MWQQLSRSEKGRVIFPGLLALGCVAGAVFCVWFGLWVRGVFWAGMAVYPLYRADRVVTSALKNRGAGTDSHENGRRGQPG